MKNEEKPSAPGLAGDPVYLKVLTEIDIIAHISSTGFERLLPANLTVAQYGVLNRLLRLGDAETVSELAAAFLVTQPTMSSTVKRLEAKGFVDFIPHPDDRRMKRVRVTRKGSAIRNKTVQSLEPHFQQFAREAPDIDWAGMLPGLTALRAVLEKRR